MITRKTSNTDIANKLADKLWEIVWESSLIVAQFTYNMRFHGPTGTPGPACNHNICNSYSHVQRLLRAIKQGQKIMRHKIRFWERALVKGSGAEHIFTRSDDLSNEPGCWTNTNILEFQTNSDELDHDRHWWQTFLKVRPGPIQVQELCNLLYWGQ